MGGESDIRIGAVGRGSSVLFVWGSGKGKGSPLIIVLSYAVNAAPLPWVLAPLELCILAPVCCATDFPCIAI